MPTILLVMCATTRQEDARLGWEQAYLRFYFDHSHVCREDLEPGPPFTYRDVARRNLREDSRARVEEAIRRWRETEEITLFTENWARRAARG